MTEDQVERWVERQVDMLDARLMSGKLSQTDYDSEIRALDAEATKKMDRAAIWDKVRERSLQLYGA